MGLEAIVQKGTQLEVQILHRRKQESRSPPFSFIFFIEKLNNYISVSCSLESVASAVVTPGRSIKQSITLEIM
jgi:hypothetical protein